MTARSSAAARILVRAAALVALSSAAAAQAPTVRWDSLGLLSADALAFVAGPAADGSLDTLVAEGAVPSPYTYSGRRSDLVRLVPGEDGWRYDLCRDGTTCSYAPHLLTTTSGALLAAGAGSFGFSRSTDGGRTWERRVADLLAECLHQSTAPALGGAIYACARGDSRPWRSTDDGRTGTWEPLGVIGPPEDASLPKAFADLPPSSALPDGRLVGGIRNGVAYSDDGGLTWTLSELWQPFRWYVVSLVVVSDPAHPYGGTVLAGLSDFVRGVGGVWASEDGGRTWAERVLWPGISSGDWTVLAVGPDGAVYAATNAIAPDPNLGQVYRTADGGRTWETLTGAGSGWGGYGSDALLFGRDGRLYAATDGGVWATRAPVPVASEPTTPEPSASGVTLSVRPNPASGTATVAIRLAAPGEVRAVVYDVRGRKVAEVFAGPLAAGERQWRVDTGAWAAGTYVVRVEGSGTVASARLTVAR